jgi:pimeloyl-ACP methyl ester carboxylesterase
MLDAPGHGAAGGRRSSVVAFARTLKAAIAQCGPASGVVAHSLGALGGIMALADGIAIDRLVFLAPGSSLEEATRRFKDIVQLPDATIALLKEQMVARFGVPWDHYDLKRFRPTAPLWIAHDRADPDVPLAETEALMQHWAGAQLTVTEGLGHYRLLRNPDLVAQATGFLTR